MTPSEALADAEVRHAAYGQRFSGSVARRMVRLLERCHEDILARLAEGNGDSLTQMRLRVLERRIQERMEQLRGEFGEALAEAVAEAAGHEADTVPAMYRAAFDGAEIAAKFVEVPLDQVRAAAMSRPFQGIHLRWAAVPEHADEMVKRQHARMRDEIRRGFVEGDSVARITARVRQAFPMGVREAETITRTALTHTAAAAKRSFMETNGDLFKAEVFVAVLDGRTSQVCRASSGKVYAVLKGPQPPMHPNCRSQRIGWAEGYPKPQARDYTAWLRDQPAEVQADLLGHAKARLFRDGKLTLAEMFSFSKGREYTLAELAAREKAAFEAAGMKI